MLRIRRRTETWLMPFHSSLRAAVRACTVAGGFWRPETRLWRMSHKCSIGFKSGDRAGNSMKSMPSCSRQAWTTLAVWGRALSCIRTKVWPTVFPGEDGTTCWSSVTAVLVESIAHILVTHSLSWGLQEVHLQCLNSTVTATYSHLPDVAVLASGRASWASLTGTSDEATSCQVPVQGPGHHALGDAKACRDVSLGGTIFQHLDQSRHLMLLQVSSHTKQKTCTSQNENKDKWDWIFQGWLATDGTRLLSMERFQANFREGRMAEWLRYWTLNHEIVGSSPAIH